MELGISRRNNRRHESLTVPRLDIPKRIHCKYRWCVRKWPSTAVSDVSAATDVRSDPDCRGIVFMVCEIVYAPVQLAYEWALAAATRSENIISITMPCREALRPIERVIARDPISKGQVFEYQIVVCSQYSETPGEAGLDNVGK